MDENTKKWLKALWAIAVLFLAVAFGAGGGCGVGLLLPLVASVRDDYGIGALMLAVAGAVIGLAGGCLLAGRVCRWFDKK